MAKVCEDNLAYLVELPIKVRLENVRQDKFYAAPFGESPSWCRVKLTQKYDDEVQNFKFFL